MASTVATDAADAAVTSAKITAEFRDACADAIDLHLADKTSASVDTVTDNVSTITIVGTITEGKDQYFSVVVDKTTKALSSFSSGDKQP